jgi:electron transport complex protein RnfC
MTQARSEAAGTRPRLWRFPGGLHLPERKSLSAERPLRTAPLPKRLIIPLQQHIGNPAKPLVGVGERVLKGQVLAQAQGYVSAPVHASSSGVVAAIAPFPVPHPSGLSAPCILMETDGQDTWADLPEPIEDYASADPLLLRERIRWAGVVGLGGAAFPSSVKLNPGRGYPIDTLILNGAECEPYITCDDLLMRQRAGEILLGARIIGHILGAKRCLIGIEDNKPEAIESLRLALAESDMRDWTRVVAIPTLYPSGGEKQLIRILTGKEVPSGGLPAQIGVLCHNVGTAAAVTAAVLEGKPLISRFVTVTGGGIAEPQNLEVLIGTPAAELIALCGGYRSGASKLILGGPMMGFGLHTDAVPITKAANCLLVLTTAESPDPGSALPCIRCGKCAEVCPARLLPQQLYWYSRARDLDRVGDYHLFDCIECGCCAHVCPSHIPLVQYYRFAKTESWALERDKRKADLARRRHEAREARLARQEEERKAKLRKKTEELDHKPASGGTDPKKAAIEAALQRAAAKKAALADQANRDTASVEGTVEPPAPHQPSA